MKLIVLSTRNGWHSRQLCEAARALGHHPIACCWRDLAGFVQTGGPVATAGDVILDHADAVLLRSMPPGTLEQIVFRMDLMQRLEATGKVVLNPPRAIEIAVDKYLALARMQQAGLPVPDTVICQRVEDAHRGFEQLGGDVVLKPMFGSEGFGISRVNDRDMLQRVCGLLQRLGSVIYMQRFIEHQFEDYRLLVLGDNVVAAMRRHNPDDWRTNISRGAMGHPVQPSAELCNLAVRAAKACQAWIAGVDLILDRAGQPYVLEVNAVPGFKALGKVTGLDIARLTIEHMAQHVEPIAQSA